MAANHQIAGFHAPKLLFQQEILVHRAVSLEWGIRVFRDPQRRASPRPVENNKLRAFTLITRGLRAGGGRTVVRAGRLTSTAAMGRRPLALKNQRNCGGTNDLELFRIMERNPQQMMEGALHPQETALPSQ